MDEYIKREEALMKLMHDGCNAKNLQSISDIPAADVAPVVRCKDCIHYDLGVCLKVYSDGNAQKDSWQSRNPNDFCSYGEKRYGGAGND